MLSGFISTHSGYWKRKLSLLLQINLVGALWNAFYLAVEPVGVWHGLKDFVEGGISPRFLIIDDGWQSINLDGQDQSQDAKNLILGGTQTTTRLHRLDEGEKFRKYEGGTMLGCNAPPFDPRKPKMLISKAIELEHAIRMWTLQCETEPLICRSLS